MSSTLSPAAAPQLVSGAALVIHGRMAYQPRESSDGEREAAEAAVKRQFARLSLVMNERVLRLWAASEAQELGRGGTAAVSRATGMSPRRIANGIKDLQELASGSPSKAPQEQRIRRAGGGRPSSTTKDAGLLPSLEVLVAPATRGDPESPLLWTSKSTRRLAVELCAQGHEVSATKVGELLDELGYSLQGTCKTREGGQHPDRNAQFEYINKQARGFQSRDQPVISVDTKKKELVGDFKNGGREWHEAGKPPNVRVHDFIDAALGKAVPYGVYDLQRNEGWVNVGINHDTGEFAVESIRRWWRRMGKRAYPNATELLVTADGGGSNASRTRLWKRELQRLASETGLDITVCHYPPGTSKWNKIEHRMFCHLTQNWRGRPLETLEVIVNLIAATRTATGLHLQAGLDTNKYEKGIKVSDAEFSSLRLNRHEFHGDWNYDLPRN